jgi:hypothetical protein
MYNGISNILTTAKKKQSKCRYWPKIREIDADSKFGSCISYKPERAYTMVKNYPNKYGIYG